MKLVIVESPYAGDIERNMRFLKSCMFDCLSRGEAPFASHMLYTQLLNDEISEQRRLGIEAGLAWAERADERVFYLNYGYSPGMTAARNYYYLQGLSYEERWCGESLG